MPSGSEWVREQVVRVSSLMQIPLLWERWYRLMTQTNVRHISASCRLPSKLYGNSSIKLRMFFATCSYLPFVVLFAST